MPFPVSQRAFQVPLPADWLEDLATVSTHISRGRRYFSLSFILYDSSGVLSPFLGSAPLGSLTLVLGPAGQPQPLGLSNTLVLFAPPVPRGVEFPVKANL